MVQLSQYEGYLYLYVLLLAVIPAIVLGLLEKRIKYYGMAATVFMIFIILGDAVQLKLIGYFVLWEFALIKAYENIRKHTANKIIYRIFLFLTMLPLVINKISGLPHLKVIGFVGISYLSFRTIQIIIELFDGSIKEIKLLDMLYFVLFFPTLSSGPIDRSRRFEKEINEKISRENYLSEYLIPGVKKILLGIVYKYIIAMVINNYWITLIPQKASIGWIALYMYGYSLYLFFDFGGYSLFAVGTSYIFGVKAPDNFNKPFLSKDMKEFWTRWHISLSRWFGDYIFSRYVLSSMRKKRFKNRATASHVAQMITMITMGFWHGLTWYYILYGVYQLSLIHI